MRIKVLASGSSGNAYAINTGNEVLLLEAGIPYKQILKDLDFNLSNVVGGLISHQHL